MTNAISKIMNHHPHSQIQTGRRIYAQHSGRRQTQKNLHMIWNAFGCMGVLSELRGSSMEPDTLSYRYKTSSSIATRIFAWKQQLAPEPSPGQ